MTPGFRTITSIKVVTRHNVECKKKHPDWTQNDSKCSCRKSIYIYEDGLDKVYSARTRSLETAEQLVREEWDKRDPVSQKLREIEEREAAKAAAAEAERAAKKMTIEEGTKRWQSYMKPKKKSTANEHRRADERILAWAKAEGLEFTSDLTFDRLDKWRGEWEPNATVHFNRAGSSRQHQFSVYLKSMCRYWAKLGYIDKDPSGDLESISVKSTPAEPLTAVQFEELLAAIDPFCASQTGIVRDMVAEIKAEFLFQRWTGLRISDAVTFSTSGLVGNKINLTTIKTGAEIKGMPIPDSVAAALAALSSDRTGFRKGYFFWKEGRSNVASIEAFWHHKIVQPLNSFLHFVNERGEPMKFHSHMLRDTFAVEMLLHDVPIEEVSRLLTHKSVVTTERHYTPWVKSRLEKLEKDAVEAMRKMGMKVSV
jgi:integrase